MSLFYGYSRPITNKQLNDKLKAHMKAHDHRVIFDLNVTRASKNAISKFSPFVDYIEDRDGETHSAMFWRPSSINPQLSTTGDHHFLYPETTIRTAFHANVPRFMFTDVSVFVVVKRNGVRPASNTWEVIVSNSDNSFSSNNSLGKSIGFKAGVNDKLFVDGSSPDDLRECTIPAKFIGKKILVSAHWLSGLRVSHVRINGEILRDSFFISNIEQIGKPYLNVFGLNLFKEYYSDINFYGMKIVEGRLGEPQIGRICKEVMVEYDL